MANVYLACEASERDQPFARKDFERLLSYARADEIKRHSVSTDPESADIIAFIGSVKPNFSDITSSALYKKFKHKSVIYYSADKSVPILPGIYTCLEDSFGARSRKSLLAGYYLRVSENDSLDIEQDIAEANYLFSFIGNVKNHPVRKEICKLVSPRAYLKDSSMDAMQQSDGVTGVNKDRGITYRDVMANSKFVLCPRGIGVSSWRLFETMRAGRVPVIISDDWIAPLGPKWNEFAIHIKEKDVGSIPAVLQKNEHRALQLGALAREQWKYWYSKERVFTTVVDDLLVAKAGHNVEHRLSRVPTYIKYLHPFYLRYWILSPIKAYLGAWITKHFAQSR